MLSQTEKIKLTPYQTWIQGFGATRRCWGLWELSHEVDEDVLLATLEKLFSAYDLASCRLEDGGHYWQSHLGSPLTVVSVGDISGLDSLAGPTAQIVLEDGKRHLKLSLPAQAGDAYFLGQFPSALEMALEAGEAQVKVQFAHYVKFLDRLNEEPEEGAKHWAGRIGEILPNQSLPFFRNQASPERACKQHCLTSEVEEAQLLACFAATVAIYTDTDTLSLARFNHGRAFPELDGVMGALGNYVPVTLDFVGDKQLGTLSEEVAKVMEVDEEWVDLFGLEKHHWNHLSGLPAFSYFEVPTASRSLKPLSLNQSGLFGLELVCWREGARLHLNLQYNPAAYGEQDIEGLFASLCHLVSQGRQEQHLKRLNLVSDTLRHHLLEELNQTTHALPLEQTFNQLFEAIAANHQNRKAVIAVTGEQREELTYEALDQMANALAWHLKTLGLGHEDRVALFAERGADFLIAVLAVFKAGGAYIPLDPHHPEDRLAAVLGQCQPKLALASAQLQAKLASAMAQVASESACPIDILKRQGLTESNCVAPTRVNTPASLSYLIFTSGSTGLPKGVMVNQRGMVNHLYAKVKDCGIHQDDVVLQNASQCFDISVWQFLSALLVGGTTLVVDDVVAKDPARFLQVTQAEATTIVEVVPSFLQMILAYYDVTGKAVAPGKPRWLLLTGEALPPAMADHWLDHFPKIPIMNAYGPTECSDDVTHFVIDKPLGPITTNTPIGKTLINTQLYILNKELEPVPHWVSGELLVGGVGVGRGYKDRPDLTAKAFIPNPFATQPGERLYRTGDLARYHHDGTIEFLGRNDFQVKIRGNRIELGEIESTLDRHPTVKRSVVVAIKDSHGNNQLAAYCETDDGHSDMLRQHIADNLPEYMVPSYICILDKLPLSSNGKIDRKALPAPSSMAADGRSFVAAANRTERLLQVLWEKALHLNEVSVTDDFFELGGHSLNGTILLHRINERFGVELALGALFETPSIREIAHKVHLAIVAKADSNRIAHIVASLNQSSETVDALSREDLTAIALQLSAEVQDQHLSIPRLARGDRDTEYALSYAQQRLYMHEVMEGGSTTYNVPGAVRIRGALNLDALEHAFDAMEERHESLRTTYHVRNTTPVQRVHDKSGRKLERRDLSHNAPDGLEAALKQVVHEDAMKPFDLEKGPVWRTLLLQLGPKDYGLVISFHHICADGWSLDIFLSELGQFYDHFDKAASLSLQPLPIQYLDFAAWQRDALDGPYFAAQRDFWEKALHGCDGSPILPLDTPRQKHQTYRGDMLYFNLGEERSKALEAYCQERGVTLFIGLLSMFYVLLYQKSGRRDLVVGSDVANRNQEDIEGVFGFFVNQLVLRGQIDLDQDFDAFLKKMKAHAFDAYRNQDLPFDEVLKLVDIERDPAIPPLFQVKFFLEHFDERELSLGGHVLEAIETDSGAARLDLTLGMRDTGSDITGFFNYNLDLFEQATILGMQERFLKIVDAVLEKQDGSVAEMCQRMDETERAARTQSRRDRRKSKMKGLKGASRRERKAVTIGTASTVEMTQIGVQILPFMVEAKIPDMVLSDWCAANQERLKELLDTHGAVFFRGFNLDRVDHFEGFGRTMISQVYKGNREHRPVTDDGAVQTPVEFSASKHLRWHNENTFNQSFPGKIIFSCAIPPEVGGETPLVDARLFYQKLDPQIRQAFVEKGVMYVRNYSGDVGLSWQQIFSTQDRDEVEARCRQEGMSWSWRANGQLQTRAVRPAVVRHPNTGEICWVNQAQHFHHHCLDEVTRLSIEKLYQEEDYPRNCYFGDGSLIPDSYMDEILRLYKALEVAVPWQQGDGVVVDNILAAHARNAYQGDRKILVCMGDMIHFDQLVTNTGGN